MVSILCTAYNHEKYIRQTLESFLAQKTDFKYEILVHDDASTDGTADIIRELTAQHPDVIFPILQTENQYSKIPSITTEILMPKAKGKYVAMCEGDDYWCDPDKLQMQVNWLETHPDYSVCVHNSEKLYCDSGREVLYNTQIAEDADLGFRDVVGKVGTVYHFSSIVGRRELFVDLPDFYYISTKYGIGDHPRAIWFALNGKIRYINRVMSVYRLFSTPTAWSSQTKKNSNTLRWLNGSLAMLSAVKSYVTGEDYVCLENQIVKYEWELLQAQGEYAKMKKPPYDVLYKKAPVTQRLWISFKQYFPGVYCAYMKLRGREDGIPEKLRK